MHFFLFFSAWLWIYIIHFWHFHWIWLDLFCTTLWNWEVFLRVALRFFVVCKVFPEAVWSEEVLLWVGAVRRSVSFYRAVLCVAPKEFFRGNCQLAFVGTWQASLSIPPDLANWHLLELAGVFQAAVIGVGRLLLDSHWNWQVPPTWHLLAGSQLTVTWVGRLLADSGVGRLLADSQWSWQAPSSWQPVELAGT